MANFVLPKATLYACADIYSLLAGRFGVIAMTVTI